MNGSNRISDINRLYELLGELARTHPRRFLSECSGYDTWPLRGVYFFYENGERRSGSGNGDRIVHVGTHALKTGSKATLWNRLSQHKGQAKSGGGNHRGSIFRLLVGTALLVRNQRPCDSWGEGSSASRDTRASEFLIEQSVTGALGRMQVLCLPIEDEAGPSSSRGLIKRNAIALLSNYHKQPIDPPSEDWLGRHCKQEKVRESGLWNQNHVDETYAPAFFDTLEKLILDPKGAT